MPKELLGKVVSSAHMKKTIVVEVENRRPHKLYKKMLKKTKRYKAHYEGEGLTVGDKVKIRETRPVSRDKKWKVI